MIKKIFIVILGILLIGIIAFVIWLRTEEEYKPPQSDEIEVSQELDGWSTITKSKFSFKSPPGWRIDVNIKNPTASLTESVIGIASSDYMYNQSTSVSTGAKLTIYEKTNPQHLSTQQVIEDKKIIKKEFALIPDDEIDQDTSSIKKITISNIEALRQDHARIETGNEYLSQIYIFTSSNIYDLDFRNFKTSLNEKEGIDLLSGILGTFKFTTNGKNTITQ